MNQDSTEQKTSAVIASLQSRVGLAVVFLSLTTSLPAYQQDAAQFGQGLIVNVPFSESEVVQVVQDVVQNGIIRGSKEYNKDEYITGAAAASSASVFPEWTEGGRVFYKVRKKALAPRNFKGSNDAGTLAVRYIVQGQGENNTVLRIDAVFVEDFRRIGHPSDGSVEGAEYNDIRDRLDATALMKSQAAEAEKKKQPLSFTREPSSSPDESPGSSIKSEVGSGLAGAPSISTPSNPASLEERVRDLRRQVERLVKSPGAPLKSAPFHSASTMQSLSPGTEVLIVITTPYWFGVETTDGHHGWMLRDELELLP